MWWQAWAFLALLVGVLVGSVTAIGAGARRTDSALGRFQAATLAPDLLEFDTGDLSSAFASVPPEKVQALPEVLDSGRAEIFAVGRPTDIELIAPVDDAIGGQFFRKKVLAGRLANPAKADEVFISFTLADEFGLGVGDRLGIDLEMFGPPGAGDAQAAPTLEPVSLTVVGIGASATDFPPQSGQGSKAAWTTPAFIAAHPQVGAFHAVALRLRHGVADVPAVESAVAQMANGRPIELFAVADQAVNTQRAIHLQVIWLWVLAGLLTLAGALVVSQLLARQGSIEAGHNVSLRALGFTAWQLWVLAMLRALVIGALGAALAVGLAIAASPLLPIGLGRNAEPHPGVSFDGAALTLGAAATILVLALLAAWPAARAARRASRTPVATRHHPPVVSAALATLGASPALTTGSRMALDSGRGPSAVPVRTTIAAAAVALATMTSAVVFTGSLDRLLANPADFGVRSDANVISIGTSAEGIGGGRDSALADPDVDAVSEGYAGVPIDLNGIRVGGLAVDGLRGPSMMGSVLEGRLPTGAGEMAVGTDTMRSLGVHVGDTVPIVVAGVAADRKFTIVGRVALPSMADGLGLGKGAAFTFTGLRGALPSQFAPPADTVLVRFRRTVDRSGAFDRLARAVESACTCELRHPDKPVDLVNFGRVEQLPLVLGGIVGAMGVLTLTNLLVSATRRRRRELALLQVLGFVPGQIRRAVAWQATTVALAAAVLGLPAGVAAGRYVWTRFADQLGVTSTSSVPLLLTLVAVPTGALLVANLAALLPARRAVSAWPGRVLREEL